jgi:ribonuclease BN (tRNA processing enzyme)
MINEKNSYNSNITLQVLGCRGSIPVSGAVHDDYGCATSCYLYMTDTQAVILDAGNGILNMPDLGDRKLSILITHSHIDHIIGLPPFLASLGEKEISIYGAVHEGLNIRGQLDTLFQKPLWPIGLDYFRCRITFHEVDEYGSTFMIGEEDDAGSVTVTAIPSNHPGGSTIYKLESGGKRMIYATDFEHEELPEDRKDDFLKKAAVEKENVPGPESLEWIVGSMGTRPFDALTSFSRKADLVLYDAQYTPEEYPGCKTFGHSTCEKAIELMRAAEVGRILLVHHVPNHTDEFLDSIEEALHSVYKCSTEEARLGREGDVIYL